MGTIFTSFFDHFFINHAAEVIPAVPTAGKKERRKSKKADPINPKLQKKINIQNRKRLKGKNETNKKTHKISVNYVSLSTSFPIIPELIPEESSISSGENKRINPRPCCLQK